MGLKIVTPIFFVAKKIGVVVLLMYSIFLCCFCEKVSLKFVCFGKNIYLCK